MATSGLTAFIGAEIIAPPSKYPRDVMLDHILGLASAVIDENKPLKDGGTYGQPGGQMLLLEPIELEREEHQGLGDVGDPGPVDRGRDARGVGGGQPQDHVTPFDRDAPHQLGAGAAIKDDSSTTWVEAPSATPFAASFPTSNQALTTDGASYLFATLTSGMSTLDGAAGDFLGVGLPIVAKFDPVVTSPHGRN